MKKYNRFAYKKEFIIGVWISFFILIAGLSTLFMLIDNVYIFSTSLLMGIWKSFLLSTLLTIFLYLITVIFFPIIKESQENQ